MKKGIKMRKVYIFVSAVITLTFVFSNTPLAFADDSQLDSSTNIIEGTKVFGEDISKLSDEELQYVPEGWRDGVTEDEYEHPPEPEKPIRVFATYPKVNNYILSNNLSAARVEYDHKSVFPSFGYRNGSPEGVVAHETANNTSTITSEITYMTRNYKNAFVHAFVDNSRVIEIHPPYLASWGAGRYANERFIHVELVRVDSFDQFARSINNYSTYIASLLYDYNLGVTSASSKGGTLWSHHDVSTILGGTTHADPLAYFSKWGYSWYEFTDLVKQKYAQMSKEERTSKLGHIRSRDVKIYSTPRDLSNYFTADSEYTNQVYYIKKQYRKGTDTYYLISRQPSFDEGTVGWVKSTDMQVYTHTTVDQKSKNFTIKGTGKAYSKIWGGSKDLVFDDLSYYTGQAFTVNLTEKVGNNIWYRGYLNGELVWIHSGYVEEVIEFTDVPTISSHYNSIYELVGMGAINGYPQPDGTYVFKPDNKILRSHAAVIFTKALKLPIPADIEKALTNFNDISVNHDYAPEIAATYEQGIFRGNQGRFMDGPLTREQMATVLVNTFKLQDTGVNIHIRLDNVSPTHQKNVKILAQHGITVALDDFRPSEPVTRGQFASFMYLSMQKTNN
jgi:N-acetylmuramoyl-L-alanine amidase CwlA